MRKDVIALGLVISLTGLSLIGFSQVTVRSEPVRNWITVAESKSQQPIYNMSVQSTFISGDRLKVYFELGPYSGGPVPEGAGVLVNLTDPSGYTNTFDIPVRPVGGTFAIAKSFPETVVNQTGIYRANADALFVSIIYLAFQKLELRQVEPKYPYATISLPGYVAFAGGLAVMLLGVKISKKPRHFRKQKSNK